LKNIIFEVMVVLTIVMSSRVWQNVRTFVQSY